MVEDGSTVTTQACPSVSDHAFSIVIDSANMKVHAARLIGCLPHAPLDEAMGNFQVIVLHAAGQSGKTTLARLVTDETPRCPHNP